MITVKNAEQYLKNKIAGIPSNPATVWEIFKEFGRNPVEGEEEIALLFECGTYNFTGENLFYLDFVRQFATEDNDEMEQLHCEFTFKPTFDLENLQFHEFYFDVEGDVEDFYRNIESLQEFQIPISMTPLNLNIFQEET
ncbi:hypothetical protein MHH85_18470 [Viridibacillus sp. FSL E2-0187]|uniref:hypothetical protein n=1 Tax=Viridibacillus TaxID=496496 RepID=UPI0030F90E73